MEQKFFTLHFHSTALLHLFDSYRPTVVAEYSAPNLSHEFVLLFRHPQAFNTCELRTSITRDHAVIVTREYFAALTNAYDFVFVFPISYFRMSLFICTGFVFVHIRHFSIDVLQILCHRYSSGISFCVYTHNDAVSSFVGDNTARLDSPPDF